MRSLCVLAAGTMLALAAPAAAGADTYCAGTSGADCFETHPATGDGLQAAITSADTNANVDGSPDTVRIGPGTYERTSGAGFETTAGDLSIVGAGQATVLTTGGASTQTVLRAATGTTGAAVRNLRTDVASAGGTGIDFFLAVSDVRVTGPGPAYIGVSIPTGGRLSRATLDPATMEDGGSAIVARGGVIEDVAVRLNRKGEHLAGTFTNAVLIFSAASTTEQTIRHLTVAGDGGAETTGIDGSAGNSQTLNLHLRDSVLRGVDVPLSRFGTASPPAPVNIDYRYSALNQAAGENREIGPGSIVAGPGNLNDPDPLLASDLSPPSCSPLIDTGDPAGAEKNDSAGDAAGAARIQGGRRDIGAFESQPPSCPASSAGAAFAVADIIGPNVDASLSTRVFGVGTEPTSVNVAAGKRRAKRAPRGTTIRYTLSEAAKVAFRIERKLKGRRVKSRGRTRRVCVKQTNKNAKRRNRRCTLYRAVGTLNRRGVAGRNTLAFSGRIGKRKLRLGRYRFVISARDAAGNTGRRRTLNFRIVK